MENNLFYDNQITYEQLQVAVDSCTLPDQLMSQGDLTMFSMWVSNTITDAYFIGWFEFTTSQTADTFQCIMELLSL